MARPRKDGLPAADVRIEGAFFDLLATTPFDKITISAVAEAAGVNRNSFYYHFADLDDLARSAVTHLLVPEIPRLLAAGLGLDSPQVIGEFERAATETGQLHRIPAVIGKHSTTTLRDMLKSALLDLWLEVFSLTRQDLDAETETTLRFALGGLLELVSQLGPDADLLAKIAEFRRLPIAQSSVRIVMATLTEASRRARARGPVTG